MKLFRNILFATFAVSAALAFTGCQDETGPTEAQAVLSDDTNLTFVAKSASPQTITVYSDAQWHLTNNSDWITVDQSTGNGTTEVTISVADNIAGGEVDVPRVDTLVFSGSLLRSRCFVRVYQDGNSYRYAPTISVSEIGSTAAGTAVNLNQAQIVAILPGGVVISDGTTNAFLVTKEDLSIGDNITIKGFVGKVNGVPAITGYDELTVVSNSDVTYPTPSDITETISSFVPSGMQYVIVNGVVTLGEGGNYIVTVSDEAAQTVTVVTPSSDLGFSELNGHRANVTGYTYGTGDGTVYLIASEVEDLGVDQVILFQDDFSWVHDLAVEAGAGDSMGKSADDAAKNAYTAVSGFAALLAEQGYEDLFPSSKTIYLQTDYLKFSKNKNVNGIKLPQFDLQGYSDVTLTFDWGVHVGGGGPDATVLEVVIEGNGMVNSGTMSHPQTADDLWTWKGETVSITGLDANSRILIRPTDFTGAVASSSLYRRWYLDNIKVVPADGAAPVVDPIGQVIYSDDFEWIDTFSAASGAGDAVTNNDPSTTAPNVFTTESIADFMTTFTEKGYTYMYGSAGKDWSTELGDANPNVMYIQKNYLKFGKTSYNAGIELPALANFGSGTGDVSIEFDWCWQVTGAFKPDIMTLTVAVDGNGSCPEGEALESAQSQVDGESKIEWQHVSVTVSGVDAASRIILRPTNYDPSVSSTRKQNRWYLDNIKIVRTK